MISDKQNEVPGLSPIYVVEIVLYDLKIGQLF